MIYLSIHQSEINVPLLLASVVYDMVFTDGITQPALLNGRRPVAGYKILT